MREYEHEEMSLAAAPARVLLARPIGLHLEAGTVALPLLATQILWINLLTDGAPALALGVDSTNRSRIHRFLRHKRLIPQTAVAEKPVAVQLAPAAFCSKDYSRMSKTRRRPKQRTGKQPRRPKPRHGNRLIITGDGNGSTVDSPATQPPTAGASA